MNGPDGTLDEISEIDRLVTYGVARLSAQLNAQASAIIKANSDVSLTEWRIIVMATFETPSTSADLARVSGLDKAQISRAVTRMQERGLVRLRPDPVDGRKAYVEMTDQGRAIYAKLIKIMRQRQAIFEKTLNQEELKTLFRLLSKLETLSKLRDFPTE